MKIIEKYTESYIYLTCRMCGLWKPPLLKHVKDVSQCLVLSKQQSKRQMLLALTPAARYQATHLTRIISNSPSNPARNLTRQGIIIYNSYKTDYYFYFVFSKNGTWKDSVIWPKSHAWERSEVGFEPGLPVSLLGAQTTHWIIGEGSPAQLDRCLLCWQARWGCPELGSF